MAKSDRVVRVHPIAAIFPLLEQRELEALAEDISAHGLRYPVTVQGNTLLDGRNRLAACKLADVEPEYAEYEGDDPVAFIVSSNLHRRHLTREQRNAVIVGLREQGMTLAKIADAVGVSDETVRRATASTNVEGRSRGEDGKTYPAHYAPRTDEDEEEEDEEEDEGESVLPHVAQNTGDNEWYTPAEYIEAARTVMGGIDLDPASTEEANAVIKAGTFYSKGDNGLTREWVGRIWMNPPYAQPLVSQFSEKLVKSVRTGSVKEAIVLVNNATETNWFSAMANVASAVLFPAQRVKFWGPDGKVAAPLQGQALIYIGSQAKRFREAFGHFGWGADTWNAL